MAADLGVAPTRAATLRRGWLGATIVLTLVPFAVAIALAPSVGAKPTTALVWLLFIGSSTHVAATGWFYTVPEVRAHMLRHRTRYVWIPLALVAAAAVLAATLSIRVVTWGLLGFFAWQFFHFQKQNLGLAALAARSSRAVPLSRVERRALTGAGLGGIAGLLGHPALLQLSLRHSFDAVFWIGAAAFAASVVVGVTALGRRAPADRTAPFTVVYLISLLFFLPVFLFASPYAAVAGLTIAHGLQHLLLMGLISGARSGSQPARVAVLILVNVALILGIGLNQASHLHNGNALGRAVYGVYLGLVMAHFVIDAGLWRLRDEFPRTFLTQRLPFLLSPNDV